MNDVIIAHHLVYVVEDHRDGFAYQIVEEIPSADALIFNHAIAKKLWGITWRDVLTTLAMEPEVSRDALLRRMYHARSK